MGSRTSEMLTAVLDGAAIDSDSRCRKEEFLKAIANGDPTACPTPRCRQEELLLAIAERGIGGDGSPIVTENITITPTTSEQTRTRSSGKYINKVTVTAIQTEEKTITENGEVTPTSGKFFSKVTVNVPSNGITPSGTKEISTNGTHDVTNYASAKVNVPSKEPVLQEKTVTENGEYVPDAGYDGFSKFNVEVESGGGTEDLTEELTAQDTALTSLESAVDKLPEPKKDSMQQRIDATNDASYLMYNFKGNNVDFLENLDMSNATSVARAFNGCNNIVTIPSLDTRNANSTEGLCYQCYALTTILGINMIKVTDASYMFYYCTKLANLTLKNIKISLQIGGGSAYSSVLTLDSLVNTIKELWDYSSGTTTYTLTMGTASLEKITNTYVKLIDVTDDMIAQDEHIASKKPCVVCESTDEGAMTITEYALLKKWNLA